MEYTHDYLLVAAGMHDKNEEDTSELEINMEVLPQDPVLLQWASTHFSSVQKIASIHDNWKC